MRERHLIAGHNHGDRDDRHGNHVQDTQDVFDTLIDLFQAFGRSRAGDDHCSSQCGYAQQRGAGRRLSAGESKLLHIVSSPSKSDVVRCYRVCSCVLLPPEAPYQAAKLYRIEYQNEVLWYRTRALLPYRRTFGLAAGLALALAFAGELVDLVAPLAALGTGLPLSSSMMVLQPSR
ncbi:hypothetical protein XACJJ10_2410004 [Xanthomonas citri pv. citri]|nr:hypothetical protein XAC40_1390015 [Xanthomonas citri pv. citri]CEI36771.1 hypothetical protein XACJJ10_2410004 [Xanthomonas citri pv. citri]